MADIALTASIDPSGVEQGTKVMDREVKQFVRSAQAEFKKLDSSTKRAAKAAERAASSASRSNIPGGRRFAAANIAMQAQDVAVQLQAGARLSTVIAQQGSQALSAFGPRGAIYGGSLAIGVAIADVISGAKQAEKEIAAMEKAAEEMGRINIALGGGAEKANREARISEKRLKMGDEEADAAERREEHERNIVRIRQSADAQRTNFEKAEINRFEAQERLIKAQQDLRRRERSASDVDKFGKAFENTVAGAGERFDKEQELIKIRQDGEQAILDLRDQGLDTEEAIAQLQLQTAEKLRSASDSKANRMAEKSAQLQLRSATRTAFVEAASWEKESALLNLRGSADEKHWKILKAEEAFLRRISRDRRDPRSVAEAEMMRKIAPTPEEQRRIDQSLARNKAEQAEAFHDRTFGKSQSDIRKQLHEEEKMRREEKKYRERQAERGGLIDVQRDMSGKVIAGRDPITGERVKGDAAQARMREFRELINPSKPSTAGKLADATVQQLVSAFAAEIEKLISK